MTREIKKIASLAVIKAALYAEKHAGKLKKEEILIKEDGSSVTVFDFVLQALISYELLTAFPSIPLMGEEESAILRENKNKKFTNSVISEVQSFYPQLTPEEIFNWIDRAHHKGGSTDSFWVLDPIDGTRGFIENEQYAIALALLEKGKLVYGFMGCPRFYPEKQGCLLLAEQGKGASIRLLNEEENRPLHLKRKELDLELIYCEPKSFASVHHSHELAKKMAQQLHLHAKSFRLDSQCKYAAVALGMASIYLRVPHPFTHVEKIWDHAAGVIILEEAGGKVTDLFGQPLDFGQGTHLVINRGIIATDGSLHEQAVQVAKQIFFQ